MAFTTRIAKGAASVHTRAALADARTAHEELELEDWINEFRSTTGFTIPHHG